jgi:hypothetical protein
MRKKNILAHLVKITRKIRRVAGEIYLALAVGIGVAFRLDQKFCHNKSFLFISV